MRALPLGVVVLLAAVAAALWLLPAPAADPAAPDPLAPLVDEKEEGKEGTREAFLTFSYRKTVEHQAHTAGGKGGVGEDKVRERFTVEVRGQAILVVPDRNYLDLKFIEALGPGGTVRKVPLPEIFGVIWGSAHPAGELGVKSCARHIRVQGQSRKEHFAMNAWGKPEPKWARDGEDVRGADTLTWTAARPARARHLDYLRVSFSSADPEATFQFSFSCACDVTKERWSIPPGWSDHHYRNDRPERSTESGVESVTIDLPAWEMERQAPADAPHRWKTRTISRGKAGLSASATRSRTSTMPPDGRFLGSTSRTDESLDVRLDLEAADYEVVITPPQGLADWVPNGGSNLGAPGDKLHFKGRVRRTRAAAATDRKVAVRVELTSSRVPGRCMNWPRNGDREPDLRILRAGTSDKLKVEPPDLAADDERSVQAAHGEFDPDEEFDVAVGCYDFGAYGAISFGGSVPVRIEGHEPKVHLELPEDENDNQVADAWERNEGVFDRKLPADWDEVAVDGQAHDGDGICLYERCRGFRNNAGAHVRLECDRKYLFIHDPANLLRGHGVSYDFAQASQLVPVFIAQDQWTGPGSQSQRKRIVNFNHEGPAGVSGPRHRVDQHALHLVRDDRRQPEGKDVPPPPGWQRVYATSGVTPPPPEDGFTLGYAWPDGTPAGRLGRSPLDKYQISIYLDTIAAHVWTLGVNSMPGQDAALLEAYVRRHPGVYEAQVRRFAGWVLCHEVGHGVGAQHHVAISGGDPTCYMRYPPATGYGPVEEDPFWLGYERYPFTFCRGGGGGVRATGGCFQQIQVTDRREGR